MKNMKNKKGFLDKNPFFLVTLANTCPFYEKVMTNWILSLFNKTSIRRILRKQTKNILNMIFTPCISYEYYRYSITIHNYFRTIYNNSVDNYYPYHNTNPQRTTTKPSNEHYLNTHLQLLLL